MKLEYVEPEDKKFREWLRRYREETSGEPPPDEWLDAYLRHIFAEQGKNRHIWWAIDEGRKIGFAVVILSPHSVNKGQVQGMIAEFFIYPEFRREGYGRRMTTAALEFLQSKGVEDIHASVTTGNVRGLRFWEACGFQISRYYLVHRPGMRTDEEDEDEEEL